MVGKRKRHSERFMGPYGPNALDYRNPQPAPDRSHRFVFETKCAEVMRRRKYSDQRSTQRQEHYDDW